MGKISIPESLRLFDKYWQSKIIGEFNGQNVKLTKMKGEFEWHHHNQQDELILVIKGTLQIHFQEEDINLAEGELFILPRGVSHKLNAAQETQVMVIEPKSTVNTVKSE